VTEVDESAYLDTLETAPVAPRTQRSIDAQKVREQRETREYKEFKTRFRATCAREKRPCHLCNGDIDYSLRYPHPLSFSMDHLIPVKERPELLMDRNNVAASHLDENIGRGTDEPSLDTGLPSETW
jgi:hypothetical protein